MLAREDGLEVARPRVQHHLRPRPGVADPDVAVGSNLEPVEAGVDPVRLRHAVRGHLAGLGVELADQRAAVDGEPDVSFLIAGHVVDVGEFPRQLVLGHHGFGGRADRTRPRLDRRVLGVRAPHARQPLDHHLALFGPEPVAAVLTARAVAPLVRGRVVPHGAPRGLHEGPLHVSHPGHDVAPARFVEPRAHLVLEAVAAAAARVDERLLLLGGALDVHEPL